MWSEIASVGMLIKNVATSFLDAIYISFLCKNTYSS